MTTVVIKGDINLTYLHIPKTAGTSISKWLRAHAGDNECAPLWHHPFLRNITPHGLVVASVRNPWARTWSGYQNLHRRYIENRTDGPTALIAEILTMHGEWPEFNPWVASLPLLQNNIVDDWSILTPQTEWISPGVDIILRTENLDADFKQIQEIFSSDDPLEVYNQSSTNIDYRNQYNNHSKQIIRKYFESDIDSWKYSI
jgi:hypothetical protein